MKLSQKVRLIIDKVEIVAKHGVLIEGLRGDSFDAYEEAVKGLQPGVVAVAFNFRGMNVQVDLL